VSRKEFTRKVKADALESAGGRCGGCRVILSPSTGIEYDHRIPDAVGGVNSVANCVPLCRNCHGGKTKTDVREIARTKRIRDKHTGAFQKAGRPMPGSRASPWKHKIGGGWVRRGEE